ncbi:extracellular solute-binding protein [Maioricimonas sp. JC845]|uniref:ABC transporter substrate-binding protein n=1 Tax=Maioricimonas sp. JC845 TaxID=3232138 RepID=UPI00345AD2B8
MRDLSALFLRGCCCLLVTLFLAGCPGGDTNSESSETAGGALEGKPISLNAVGTIGDSPAWELAIAEWEAATGAACVQTVLSTAVPDDVEPAVTETPGLMVVPLLGLPDLIQARLVATVPDDVAEGTQSPWRELFDGLRRGVASPQERTTNLPIAAPPLLLWYRADLLEQANLEPPRTWKDYDALAATVGEWGNGAFVAEPWEGDFAATMLLARSASAALHPDNFSFYLDVSSGEPLIASEPFVRTLQSILDARQSSPESFQARSPADCWKALVTGDAAMALTFGPSVESAPSNSETAPERPEGARLAAVPLPGSVEVFDHETGTWQTLDQRLNRVTVVGQGGYCVCVSDSAGEELRKAAWNLWETIEAAERDQGLRGDHWSLCRSSQLGTIAPPPGVLRGLEPTQFSDAVAESLREPRVVLDIALPERETFAHSLAEALHRALEGTATPQDVLKQAADEWSAHAQQIGPEHVLNTCRAAMGLSPMPVMSR